MSKNDFQSIKKQLEAGASSAKKQPSFEGKSEGYKKIATSLIAGAHTPATDHMILPPSNQTDRDFWKSYWDPYGTYQADLDAAASAAKQRYKDALAANRQAGTMTFDPMYAGYATDELSAAQMNTNKNYGKFVSRDELARLRKDWKDAETGASRARSEADYWKQMQKFDNDADAVVADYNAQIQAIKDNPEPWTDVSKQDPNITKTRALEKQRDAFIATNTQYKNSAEDYAAVMAWSEGHNGSKKSYDEALAAYNEANEKLKAVLPQNVFSGIFNSKAAEALAPLGSAISHVLQVFFPDKDVPPEVQQLVRERDKAAAVLQYAQDHQYDEIPLKEDFDLKADEGEIAFNEYLESPEYSNQIMGGGGSKIGGLPTYGNMDAWTDDERKTFYYLFASDRDAATQYSNVVTQQHEKESAQKRDLAAEEFATRDFATGFLSAVGSVPANLVGGIYDYAAMREEQKYRGGVYETQYHGLSRWADTVRGSISQELNQYGTIPEGVPVIGGKGLGDAYQLSMSMVESALAVATGNRMSALMFFGPAAASGTRNALQRGLSPEKALQLGMFNGIFEVMCEEVSLDKLLKQGSLSDILRRGVWKTVFVQGAIEGSEEFATTFLNTMADLMSNKDESEFYQNMYAKMANGMSYEDAVREARREWLNDLMYDALGGFISGGFMTGGRFASQLAPAAMTNYNGNSQALLDSARAVGDQSRSAQMADRYQNRVNRKGSLSNLQAFQLQDTVATESNEADRATLQNVVEQRLQDQSAEGLTNAEAKRMAADIVNRALNPETASTKEFESDLAKEVYEDLAQQLKGETKTDSWVPTQDLVRTKVRDTITTSLKNVQVQDSTEQHEVKKATMVDGKLKLTVEQNGQDKEYSLDELNLSEDQQKALTTLTRVLGQDAAAAYNGMTAKNLTGTTESVLRYAAAFASVRDILGRNNVKEEAALKSPFRNGLTDAQTLQALKIGQKLGPVKEEQTTKSKRGTGKITLDGGTLKDGTVLQGVKNREEVENSVRYKQIQTLAEALGVDVNIYQSRAVNEEGDLGLTPYGAYEDGVVWLDWNAGVDNENNLNSDTEHMIFLTMSHELTHFLEQNAPEEYKALRDLVTEYLADSEEVDFNDLVKTKLRQQPNLDYDRAVREVIADACETMLSRSTVVEQIANENPSLFQRIWTFVKDFFDSIRSFFETAQKSPHTAEAKAIQEVADKVSEVWDRALKVAVESRLSEDERANIPTADQVVQAVPDVADEALTSQQKQQIAEAQVQQETEDTTAEEESAQQEIEDTTEAEPVTDTEHETAEESAQEAPVRSEQRQTTSEKLVLPFDVDYEPFDVDYGVTEEEKARRLAEWSREREQREAQQKAEQEAKQRAEEERKRAEEEEIREKRRPKPEKVKQKDVDRVFNFLSKQPGWVSETEISREDIAFYLSTITGLRTREVVNALDEDYFTWGYGFRHGAGFEDIANVLVAGSAKSFWGNDILKLKHAIEGRKIALQQQTQQTTETTQQPVQQPVQQQSQQTTEATQQPTQPTQQNTNGNVQNQTSSAESAARQQVDNILISNIVRAARNAGIDLREYYNTTADLNAFNLSPADLRVVVDALAPVVNQLKAKGDTVAEKSLNRLADHAEKPQLKPTQPAQTEKKQTAKEKAAVKRRFNAAVDSLIEAYLFDGIDLSRQDAERMVMEYAALHDGYFSMIDEAKQKGELKTQKQYARDFYETLEADEAEAFENLEAESQELVARMGDGTTIEANEDGEMEIAVSEDRNTIAFSPRTYQDSGKAKLVAALKENGHTQEEIDAVTEMIEATGDFLEKLADQFAESHGYMNLKNNLLATVSTNVKTGKQVISTLVNNGDYPVNLDLQLICKKRVAYMHMLTRLIDDGVFERVDFKGSAIADLNKVLRDGGFETACLGCFVEARRLQLQAWAETIVDEWNAAVDKRNPQAGFFNFAQGGNALNDMEIAGLITELENGGKKNDKGNLNLGVGAVADKMGRLLDRIPSLQQHLTVADLLTPQGMSTLREYDQNLFSLVKQRYGANSPKIVQDFNAYNSEIADLSFKFVKDMIGETVKGSGKYTRQAKKALKREAGESKEAYNRRVETEAMRRYLYDIGGARIQSFSDFMIENVFDYMQIIADLSAREFPLHGYSKEAVFLRLFGMTGGKFNGSLIAHVDGSMGKEYAGLLPASEASNGRGIVVEVDGKKYAICFDDYARHVATGSFIQSIGMKDIVALQLDPRYSKNIGSITIGVSDKQILAMLDSPYFRMVIPYHSSGILPEFARLVGVNYYNDYQDYQTTKVAKCFDLDGNPVDGFWQANGKAIGIDTHFDFNEAVQRLGDAKAAADEYLEWCKQRHPVYDGKKLVGYATFMPKFSDSPYGTDFTTHPNYYKLLEDFNVYDSLDEASALQGAVTMTFPSEATRLTAEQMTAYKQALRDTGLYTEKEIDKYAAKADMTFQEIIAEEIGNRAEYESKQAKVWDATVDKAETMLLEKYGREGSKTQLSAREHTEAVQEDLGEAGRQEQRVQFSRRVSDPDTLKFLNDQLERGDVIHTYKTFLEVIDEDGTVRLLPPMAAKQRDANGKLVWANSMAVNEWEESVGNPNSKGIISKVNSKGETKWYYRLVKDNGKTVDAAYDPYQHSSDVVLNDQFEEAYQRPQLVTYECVIPKSELTSGYWYRQARADGQIVEAALPVGQHSWKKGTVAGRLKHTDRSVYLTRWLMPVRRVENSEVARMYKEILDKEDTPVAVPFNVVPPGLLTELEKIGVEIDYEGSPGYRYRANKKAASAGSKAQYSARTGEKSDRDLLLDANEASMTDAEKRARADYKAKADVFRQRQQAVMTDIDALDKAVRAGNAAEANKLRTRLTASEKKMSEALAALTEAERGPELREILRREREIQRMRISARFHDSQSRRELRQRIDRLWKDLNKRITNPTEKKRIPVELMQQAIDVLEAINMDTTREGSQNGQKLRDKLNELRARYAALKNDNDFRRAAVYDPQIAEYLDRMIELVGDTPINRMSTAQLTAVFNVLKALDHTARHAVKLQLRGQEVEAYEVSKHMTEETRSVSKKMTGPVQSFFNAQLSPARMFNRFGGYTKNSYWSQIYEMLDDGQLKQTQLAMEGSLIFEDLLQGKDYDRFLDPKNTVDIGLKDENGNAIPITHGMMVALYMHLQNEQNARHVAYGGLTIPALRDYYSGRKVKGSENAVRVGGVLQELAELNDRIREEEDANVLEDLKAQRDEIAAKAMGMIAQLRSAIESKLTEYDRKWIAASRELFDGFSKRVLNETTMEVYGFKRATVDNYMPIWVDGDFLNSPFESVAKDMSLENAGFMKERVDSSKPIRLADISDVTASQIRKVSQYCGLMPVIRSFNKVWGKTQTGYRDSLQKAVHDTFGQSGIKYIENLMADLNGARGTEDSALGEFLNRMRGHMAQASLTLSLRTALGQTASYPTAAAVLGWDALSKGIANYKKVDPKLIQKWSPLLYHRMKGFSMPELGDIAGMNSKWDRIWKKARWATGWIQAMDGFTVGQLVWSASEAYVQIHNKQLQKGSDAYYEAVAKKFNEAVELTQPNYTTMQRPDILRSPNALVKQLTMFLTQRLQNFNIVFDACATYSKYRSDFREKKNGVTAEDVRQAGVQTRTAVISQVVAAATIVAFKFMADVLLHAMNNYRDDDDELTKESISLELLDMFIDSLAGNVLGGGELYDIIESKVFGKTYYGIEVSGVSTVTDLISAANKVFDHVASGKASVKDLDLLAKRLGPVAGLPYANAKKIVDGCRYWIEDAINGELGSFEAGVDRTTAQQAHRLYRAYVAMDYGQVEKIRAEVPEDKLDDLDTAVRSYIKDQYKAGDMTVYEAARQLQKYGGASDQIMSNFIRDQFTEGNLKEKDAIKMLTQYAGKTEEAATKSVRGWSAKQETGLNYDDIDDQFQLGEITEKQARDALVKYGLDGDKADMRVAWWSYRNSNPGTALTDGKFETYWKNYKPIGLTPAVYEGFLTKWNAIQGTDKNGDGKADSGSKKPDRVKLIDSLPISSSQKDELFNMNWSTGLEDTPWHK